MNYVYLSAVLFAIACALMGLKKKRLPLGIVLGLLLGPIGILIMLVIPEAGPKCEECGTITKPGARVCHNCGYPLAGRTLAEIMAAKK